MQVRGAVVRKTPGKYEVVDLELDKPRRGELQVKMVASGLCHSDDHLATGDIPMAVYPVAGGHEGAGVVEAVGPDTPGWEKGDHVVFSFLPACGKCKWCARGQQNLCDLGATLLAGSRWDDPTSYRLHLDNGNPVAQMCGLSTFCTHTTVATESAVKIPKDLPLERLCLLGCGVGTGFGSAVRSANVRPGETVIVMGIGGIGMNAVQGAAYAGADNVIAVDPIPYKLEQAKKFGATHTYKDMAEAGDFARSVTNGQGADSAIVTVGVTEGKHVAEAFAAIRKAGTVVVTGLGDITHAELPIPLGELTLFQKRIQGSLFGESSPSADIPDQINMYRHGKLKLDELVTTEYDLDDIARGYEDMHSGKNIRGVIRY